MTTENIVFIEYNGANRPWQVWTDEKQMYDFSMKQGELLAEWAGAGNTYIHPLTISGKKPRKIWFKEDFRPTNGGVLGDIKLTNREIAEFGYSRIETPTHLVEIVEAIEYSY